MGNAWTPGTAGFALASATAAAAGSSVSTVPPVPAAPAALSPGAPLIQFTVGVPLALFTNTLLTSSTGSATDPPGFTCTGWLAASPTNRSTELSGSFCTTTQLHAFAVPPFNAAAVV